MLYGLMTYTARNFVNNNRPCISCYTRKGLTAIAPIMVLNECMVNFYCQFLCYLNHMSKEGREVHIFRAASRKCPEMNPPEPGIAIPPAAKDIVKKYPICFQREGKVKVGNMSVWCEHVMPGHGDHIACPSTYYGARSPIIIPSIAKGTNPISDIYQYCQKIGQGVLLQSSCQETKYCEMQKK